MDVTLRLWEPHDLALLQLTNAPEMNEHLGGSETPEKVLSRHQRYLDGPALGTARMFVIEADGQRAGSIGVWDSAHLGGDILETGWKVLPAFQGRGLATAAARQLVAVARELHRMQWLHAFPGRENAASNATCRSAGFTLVGPVEVEYPKGSWMRSNDWRLDLYASGASPHSAM